MSQHIKECVLNIVDTLENPPQLDEMEMYDLGYDVGYGTEDAYLSAWDYLSDALDIEFITDCNGNYLGARVLVTFGGPTIWVNTRTYQVEGGWWGDNCVREFTDTIGLDDACEQQWLCI